MALFRKETYNLRHYMHLRHRYGNNRHAGIFLGKKNPIKLGIKKGMCVGQHRSASWMNCCALPIPAPLHKIFVRGSPYLFSNFGAGKGFLKWCRDRPHELLALPRKKYHIKRTLSISGDLHASSSPIYLYGPFC